MPTIQLSRGRGPGGPFMFVPGAMLVGMGLLILFFPDLLRLLVASLFITLGIILLGAAWQLRRGGFANGFANRMKDRFRGPFDP